MKRLVYTDENGLERMVLLRDRDPDDPALGVQVSPPPLQRLTNLTLDELTQMSQLLINRGLFRWRDVVAQQNGLTNITRIVARNNGWNRAKTNEVRRQLTALYRQYEKEEMK